MALEQVLIGLLVAALGLLAIRIGWGLPGPSWGGTVGRSEGIGLFMTLALFMLGLFLMIWGIAYAS